MRILDFIVDKQKITKSPMCDFTGLVAGSSGYLRARFAFSKEWAGYLKIAVFSCKDCTEYAPLVGNTCQIPPQVLEGNSFKVSVIGKRGGDKLPCGCVTVIQRRV